MAARKWAPFPDPDGRFSYEGPALRKAWARLHGGDAEPWPSGRNGAARQAAWRHFHAGRFREACDAGAALGVDGADAANKAAGVYATYLARDAAQATQILREAIARGERAVAESPGRANSHYFLAFVLGRYSQRISVVKALAEGLGSKVQQALERALNIEPRHAEAHVALGVFHAEVIEKLGALAGRLSYGASRDAALEHFATALDLAPHSPIVRLEYSRALRLIAPREAAKPRALLEEAAAIAPADAMESLDVAAARAALG